MIARVNILMPFALTIPQTDDLSAIEVTWTRYAARILPPRVAAITYSELTNDPQISLHDAILRLEPASPQPLSGEIQVNGIPTFQANLLQIEFAAADFDRRIADPSTDFATRGDPPIEIPFKIANQFLGRLRTVTRGDRIQPVDPRSHPWRLDYLADTGELLAKTEGKVRRRFGHQMKFHATALSAGAWEQCRSLGDAFSPPIWDTLLLDAESLLPDVDASIALANAGLEVFATWVTKRLSEACAGTSRREHPSNEICTRFESLWSWINDRDNWYQEPSVSDRFDVVLKILANKSLKESDSSLWESFRNLREARNKVSHEGKALIGGKEITPDKAAELIKNAGRIVDWCEELLPEHLHRPTRSETYQVSFIRWLGPVDTPLSTMDPENWTSG